MRVKLLCYLLILFILYFCNTLCMNFHELIKTDKRKITIQKPSPTSPQKFPPKSPQLQSMGYSGKKTKLDKQLSTLIRIHSFEEYQKNLIPKKKKKKRKKKKKKLVKKICKKVKQTSKKQYLNPIKINKFEELCKKSLSEEYNKPEQKLYIHPRRSSFMCIRKHKKKKNQTSERYKSEGGNLVFDIRSFTDFCGSCLDEETPALYMQYLLNIISPSINKYGGVIMDIPGDGFFAFFPKKKNSYKNLCKNIYLCSIEIFNKFEFLNDYIKIVNKLEDITNDLIYPIANLIQNIEKNKTYPLDTTIINDIKKRINNNIETINKSENFETNTKHITTTIEYMSNILNIINRHILELYLKDKNFEMDVFLASKIKTIILEIKNITNNAKKLLINIGNDKDFLFIPDFVSPLETLLTDLETTILGEKINLIRKSNLSKTSKNNITESKRNKKIEWPVRCGIGVEIGTSFFFKLCKHLGQNRLTLIPSISQITNSSERLQSFSNYIYKTWKEYRPFVASEKFYENIKNSFENLFKSTIGTRKEEKPFKYFLWKKEKKSSNLPLFKNIARLKGIKKTVYAYSCPAENIRKYYKKNKEKFDNQPSKPNEPLDFIENKCENDCQEIPEEAIFENNM